MAVYPPGPASATVVTMPSLPSSTRTRTRGSPDRLVVAFSDIEMGAGGPFDDFPRSDFLADVIRGYGREPYRWLSVDLVFNGDTFDLLKTGFRGGYPHHVTREIALEKMAQVAKAHPAFFQAVREFLADDPGRRTASFVVGNHDMELFFPEVRAMLRELLGGANGVEFPGLSTSFGRLHVEHGSQHDPLFRIDPDRPLVEGRSGEKLLNLSWASVALLDVAIPLQPLLYHHDRLKPKELVLELIPEVRELLTSQFWSYWTKDYWRDFLGGSDPLKTVSWTMLRELVRRLVSLDVDVTMGDELQRMLTDSDDLDVCVVGHQHEPAWWNHGAKKVLRTGCIRDEFAIEDRGAVQVPLNKTWAEVYMRDDEVVRSQLVESPAPARPRDTMPESIFEVVPLLRERLASQATRDKEGLAQRAQEAREQGLKSLLGRS